GYEPEVDVSRAVLSPRTCRVSRTDAPAIDARFAVDGPTLISPVLPTLHGPRGCRRPVDPPHRLCAVGWPEALRGPPGLPTGGGTDGTPRPPQATRRVGDHRPQRGKRSRQRYDLSPDRARACARARDPGPGRLGLRLAAAERR